MRRVVPHVTDSGIGNPDKQLLAQIVNVIKRDPKHPSEDPRLMSADFVFWVERIRAQLALDATRIVCSREGIPDGWWPTHGRNPATRSGWRGYFNTRR